MSGKAVNIDLRKLDDMIRRKGVNLAWYKTQRCPCLDDNGYSDPVCAFCGGLGWIREPSQVIRALWTAHNPKRTLDKPGLVEAGSRQVTPPRWVRLAEGDWLRMTQFPVRASEIVTFGAPTGDRLEALAPAKILKLQAIRQGAMITFDPAEYTAPDGKTVAEDGTILWQPGATVWPGEKVAVEYMHHEVYQVYRGDLPMQRGAEDKRLMDRALARLITRKKLREQQGTEP